MAISVFDLFSIGIGPSQLAHRRPDAGGPHLRARARRRRRARSASTRVRVELFGSLGATGHGHGSDRAVILGLEGEAPETVDTATVAARVAAVRDDRPGARCSASTTSRSSDDDLVLHRRDAACRSTRTACASPRTTADGAVLRERTYYSVGGGFVVDEAAAGADRIKPDDTAAAVPVHDRRRAARPLPRDRDCRSAA